jgi:hypothetical protein
MMIFLEAANMRRTAVYPLKTVFYVRSLVCHLDDDIIDVN